MNALTCTTYFILTLVPLALSAGFLLVHYEIVRDRAFWLRGAAAIGAAILVLLPFMLPYYFVMKLYGFVRTIDDVAINSPSPIHWLVVDRRNKLWQGLGAGVPGNAHQLFPGLLPILLALPLFFSRKGEPVAAARDANTSRRRVLRLLDAAALVAAIIMLIAAGYTGSTAALYGIEIFRHVTAARMLFLVMVVLLVRFSLAYPNAWRWTSEKNLIDSLRASKRGDAFALGLVWVACGFLGSLGTNFFLNTILFDFVPLFRAIRIPTHWAMIAYLGLAVLAGCGVEVLAQRFKAWRPDARPLLVNALIVAVAALLLFELRAAPLEFVRGKVFPDEITLRLKQTPMRGGLVELPHDLGRALPHRYMLRAADHQKPLVNASSSFISPLTWEISQVTGTGQIPMKFVDLLESIPASYLVIHNSAVPAERRLDYESFLVNAVASGRLRFIRSFGERDDLYAVVKTEPQAVSEAPLPFSGEVKDWSRINREEPANLVGRFRPWGQAVYRFHVASFGQMPRYAEFIPDIELIGRGVVVGSENEQANLEYSLSRFADAWTAQPRFQARFGSLTNEEFVDKLAANAAIVLEPAERDDLSGKLNQSTITRANVLLWFVNKREFVEKEDKRSLVLLSYFGYLHRNPDDPPDRDMRGFDFWLKELQASGDFGKVLQAFSESIEYERGLHEGKR